MTSKWLTIEGGSGSSGLYAYRSEDGTFAVSVLVYPKAWPEAPFGDAKQFYLSEQQGREVFTVLLQEGTSLRFSVESSTEPAIENMIAEMQLRRKAWRVNRESQQKRQPGGAAAFDAEASDLELAHTSGTSLPVECALTFSLRSTRDAEAARPPIDDPAKASGALTEALRDLAWLCLRAGELRSASTDGGGEESAGQLLDAARAADEVDPLALLAELDFVHELHRLQHRIRKGYVSEEERLAAIRGRITDRGVLEYEMTGIPLLECRFDEFVEATPLFRVLVTALDVVAAGTLRSTLGIDAESVFGSGSEVHPMTMREQLRSIPSLPIPVARATADRLRLTRLQQEWQQPLDLARRILRAESVETGYATQEGSMTVWTVDTAKVWESILEQAFQAAGNGTHVSRPTMQPPWQRLGKERQVDLTVQHGGKTYLVDAKYKLGTPGSSTADQYQLFAYSLLHGVTYSSERNVFVPCPDGQRPAAVALVYPSKSAEPLVQAHGNPRQRETTNLMSAADKANASLHPPLHLLTASFPPPATVRNEGTWKEYLERVGKRLQQQLESPTST